MEVLQRPTQPSQAIMPARVVDPNDVFNKFKKRAPLEFYGNEDSLDADKWVVQIEKIFEVFKCTGNDGFNWQPICWEARRKCSGHRMRLLRMQLHGHHLMRCSVRSIYDPTSQPLRLLSLNHWSRETTPFRSMNSSLQTCLGLHHLWRIPKLTRLCGLSSAKPPYQGKGDQHYLGYFWGEPQAGLLGWGVH